MDEQQKKREKIRDDLVLSRNVFYALENFLDTYNDAKSKVNDEASKNLFDRVARDVLTPKCHFTAPVNMGKNEATKKFIKASIEAGKNVVVVDEADSFIDAIFKNVKRLKAITMTVKLSEVERMCHHNVSNLYNKIRYSKYINKEGDINKILCRIGWQVKHKSGRHWIPTDIVPKQLYIIVNNGKTIEWNVGVIQAVLVEYKRMLNEKADVVLVNLIR